MATLASRQVPLHVLPPPTARATLRAENTFPMSRRGWRGRYDLLLLVRQGLGACTLEPTQGVITGDWRSSDIVGVTHEGLSIHLHVTSCLGCCFVSTISFIAKDTHQHKRAIAALLTLLLPPEADQGWSAPAGADLARANNMPRVWSHEDSMLPLGSEGGSSIPIYDAPLEPALVPGLAESLEKLLPTSARAPLLPPREELLPPPCASRTSTHGSSMSTSYA